MKAFTPRNLIANPETAADFERNVVIAGHNLFCKQGCKCEPRCPQCGSDLFLCPIDDDRGMVTEQCAGCEYVSEPYVIYEEPLHAEFILDDILDAEVIG